MKPGALLLAGTLWFAASLVTVGRSDETNTTYKALFIDRQDITSLVINVEYRPDYLNRPTTLPNTLYGFAGNAEITIPWQNIRRIDFFDGSRQFNTAVLLKDDRRVLMRVDAAGTVYKGTNDYGGLFSLRAEYVRSIIFQ